MRSTYLNIVVFCFMILSAGSSKADAQFNNFCAGEWNFRCPDMLDGFDTGILKITYDSVCIEFPELRQTSISRSFRYVNGNLVFMVEINGQEVICTIRSENENIISGSLMTDFSSFPMVLIKEKAKNH